MLSTVGATYGQALHLRGRVVDAATRAPLPYASLGIRGTSVGTVADNAGRFQLTLPAERAADTVRFGLVGYRSVGRPARALATGAASDSGLVVALTEAAVALPTATVRAPHLRPRVAGNPRATSRHSVALFDDNLLGNQIAQRIDVRRPSWLEEVSFHISRCSYDSLFSRINVLAIDSVTGLPGASLLPRPVLYARVRRGDIRESVRVDLRAFNLRLTRDVVVGLETVRDLGPGQLYFSARVLGGPIFGRDGPLGEWQKLSGFGVGIAATLLAER